MGYDAVEGISDVVFFGMDKADNPVMIPVDTELFWDSFKHFWEFKDCLRRDCKRVWKLISEDLEGSGIPSGMMNQIREDAKAIEVFSWQELHRLVRSIESVLLYFSFRKELEKTFDKSEDITYGEELMTYHRAFSRLENALSMYIRLFEIRDCNETDSLDDVPKVILESEAMFEKLFYAVILRT